MKYTNQLSLLTSFILFGLLLTACGPDTGEARLYGQWKNKKDHVYIFEEGGNAMWVYPVGAQTDTFFIKYRLDDVKEPAQLDFYDFDSGPMKGKTMYGIVEFMEDERGEAIRVNFQVGEDESVRPEGVGKGGGRLYVRL